MIETEYQFNFHSTKIEYRFSRLRSVHLTARLHLLSVKQQQQQQRQKIKQSKKKERKQREKGKGKKTIIKNNKNNNKKPLKTLKTTKVLVS